MGLLLVTPWGSRIVSCPLEALHSFYSLTLVLICSPVFRAIQIIPTRLLVNTSPTTQLRTDAERFWLSFRFPYGFGSRSPRRIVSAVSNLCKRIYFGLTNSICRSTKKKNLCKLGTFFSLVHHDELSFYLNSYEKVVLRNLGTCPIPSLQRLS